MQKLVLDESWERTLGKNDRLLIERLFEQSKNKKELFTPLRLAINHRGDLLVMVLIHNFTDQDLDMRKVTLHLLKSNKIVTSQVFQEKRLYIDLKTSMPWTFIFPKDSILDITQADNLSLEIASLEGDQR